MNNATEQDRIYLDLDGRFKLIHLPFWARPDMADDNLMAAIRAARAWAKLGKSRLTSSVVVAGICGD
jgi:hypothetical protein